MIRSLALCAIVTLPAAAQTASEENLIPRLIDTGCFELVSALNGCEQVTLLVSESEPDSADVLIYPDRRTNDAEGPLVIARGVAFNGAMWGMAPALEDIPGGFRLSSEQSGIGRFPWFETIEIAHDGTDFVVTRYSYSSYDRAWPRYMSCEMDFLTGEYRTESERGDPENEALEPDIAVTEGTIDPVNAPLRDWRTQIHAPQTCMDAAAAAFADD